MSIPVKLRISTKHVLPTNHAFSMYDRFQPQHAPDLDAVLNEFSSVPRHMPPPLLPVEEPDAPPESAPAPFEFSPEEALAELDAELEDDEFDPEELQTWMEDMLDEYFNDQQENSDNTGRFVFTTEAEMEVMPGQITLTYDETDGSTLGKTRNVIRFNRADPHCLTIQRAGDLMNTLICEKGRRHTSAYTSPMLPMPMEACIYTHRCDVDLDEEGGVVFLDYMIEIRGADVQRTTMRIDIEPMPQ